MSEKDSITDELRSDILIGAYPPGERLVELRLTKEYGCGRLAVRTALVELSAEGLVDREANRGATVRQVSIEEAIQITEARAALEGLLARRAAEQATGTDHAVLKTIGEQMVEAVATDDRATYSTLNSELHAQVRAISGHHVGAGLVAQLRNRGAQHKFLLAAVPGRAATSVVQHQAIIDAIVTGDGDAAAAAMEDHLSSVIDTLRDWPADD